MEKVRAYAVVVGVLPTTIVQRAGAGGGETWSKWESGKASPTLRTADKILKYIKDNPAPVTADSAAEPLKEAS